MEDRGVVLDAGPTRVAPDGQPQSNEEWLGRLRDTGPVREEAVAWLHSLMVRAAWHQINRMPDSWRLGAARRDEVAHSAADEATGDARGGQ
jgi:RNA polymerase sigma-70 factor (ECF subfamily)